jgi:phosphatidylserine synthase
MLIGAAIFDRLDGAVARRLGLTDPPPGEKPRRRISVGSILDDVADAISFCAAPALIFYTVLSASTHPEIRGLPIGIIAALYTALGIARLVYFTLDRNPIPGFFKGMPAPAAALLVVAPLIMFSTSLETGSTLEYHWGLFSCGTMLLAALVMNLYPIHYVHVGRFMEVHPRFGRFMMLLIVICVFTPYFGYMALLALFVYLFSPLFSWRIDSRIFSRKEEIPSHGTGPS